MHRPAGHPAGCHVVTAGLPVPVPRTAQVLYKTGKVFSGRGLDKCADNCELIRAEVDAFKKFVPLVQVRGKWGRGRDLGIGCVRA